MRAEPCGRTLAQNRKLHGLLVEVQRKSGLNKEDAAALLRRLCRAVSGQESSARLSVAQAERVILALIGELGGKPAEAGEPERPQSAGDAITPQQQRYVSGLFELLGWDRTRSIAFCRRQCGVPWPQTRRHVDQLVHALEAMVSREVDVEDVRRRLERLAGADLSGDSWKAGWVADVALRLAEASDARRFLTPGRLVKLAEVEGWAAENGLLPAG